MLVDGRAGAVLVVVGRAGAVLVVVGRAGPLVVDGAGGAREAGGVPVQPAGEGVEVVIGRAGPLVGFDVAGAGLAKMVGCAGFVVLGIGAGIGRPMGSGASGASPPPSFFGPSRSGRPRNRLNGSMKSHAATNASASRTRIVPRFFM